MIASPQFVIPWESLELLKRGGSDREVVYHIQRSQGESLSKLPICPNIRAHFVEFFPDHYSMVRLCKRCEHESASRAPSAFVIERAIQ